MAQLNRKRFDFEPYCSRPGDVAKSHVKVTKVFCELFLQISDRFLIPFFQKQTATIFDWPRRGIRPYSPHATTGLIKPC